MKEPDYISQVARLFHVPASTLRYWDNEGLIHFERCEDNRYRLPSFHMMMELCDVILHRNSSIPIKVLKRWPQMSTQEMDEILLQNERQLEEKLQSLQLSLERVHARRDTLKRLQTLREQPLLLEWLRMPALRPFSFHDGEAVQTYIHDSYQSAIFLQPGVPMQYAVFLPPGPEGPLRAQDQEPRPYLKGLLRIVDHVPSSHNGMQFAAEAKRLGWQAGALIGRYLLTACEREVRYSYYEAWLELLKQEPEI